MEFPFLKERKIAIVLGTRPEIIKMFPLIIELEKNNIPYVLIHTNQHYTENMDAVFFRQLNIKAPDYNLGIGSGSHGNQTGRMLIEIEKIFMKENPDLVLVEGDTNSVLAGALAATKMSIPVGHVEAGLRSYDKRMPEEINRILTDHTSQFEFCPTKKQEAILLSEGISKENIFVVGNTIVDSVNGVFGLENDILKKLNLKAGGYIFLTLHRAENVDNKERLGFIIQQIGKLKQAGKEIIFPIHPRTSKMLAQFSLALPENVRLIEPIDFLASVNLQKNASCVITDSGGIQEEACILKVPCITLRDNTERPETIEVGANKLMSNCLFSDYQEMTRRNRAWSNPFGDGKTALRILDIINNKYENQHERNLT